MKNKLILVQDVFFLIQSKRDFRDCQMTEGRHFCNNARVVDGQFTYHNEHSFGDLSA